MIAPRKMCPYPLARLAWSRRGPRSLGPGRRPPRGGLLRAREITPLDSQVLCYYKGMSPPRETAMMLCSMLIAVYLGAVLVPCAPAAGTTRDSHPSYGAAHHAESGHTAPVSHEEPHQYAAEHPAHAPAALSAPCACGCSEPNELVSKVRTQSNGIRSPAPGWEPPVSPGAYPQPLAFWCEGPVLPIERVPILS